MTQVSKNVIRDLLPVYVAGEATPDTCALVEEFLRQDAELRALADRARAVEIPLPAAAGPTEMLEMRSLERTRGLLAGRNWASGVAIAMTLLPFSVAFENSRFTFFMARDQPHAAATGLGVALVAWTIALSLEARLRSSGFESRWTFGSWVRWVLVGTGLGLGASITIQHWTGPSLWVGILPGVGFGGACWLSAWFRRRSAATPTASR
jgi:hypothetical protein